MKPSKMFGKFKIQLPLDMFKGLELEIQILDNKHLRQMVYVGIASKEKHINIICKAIKEYISSFDDTEDAFEIEDIILTSMLATRTFEDILATFEDIVRHEVNRTSYIIDRKEVDICEKILNNSSFVNGCSYLNEIIYE